MATTATNDASLRGRHSDRQEAGGRRVIAAACRHTPGNVRVQREALLVLNALPASQQTQSGAPGALATGAPNLFRSGPKFARVNKFLGALPRGRFEKESAGASPFVAVREMLSDMLGWGASQPEHQFDAQLKKQSVTLEDSSRICRGAPANGDSPIDGYWSALCDKPLLRNTGRCLTLLVEAVPVRAHHAPRGLTSAPRRLRISPFPRFPWAHANPNRDPDQAHGDVSCPQQGERGT